MMKDAELKVLDVNIIIEGERAREDYGNLDDLADAIKEEGVIQPITVNQDMKLLAGGRRLRAAKMAKVSTIPVLIRTTTTVGDEMEIELMENIMRKDFTWAEKAKLTADIQEYHEKHSDNKWSQRRTAQLLGCALGKVNKNIQLAGLLKEMPELKKLPSEKDAFKALKKMQEAVLVKELEKRHTQAVGVTDRLRIASCNYQVGDAFEGLAEMEESVVAFIECDPPYGIDLQSAKAKEKKGAAGLKDYNEVADSEYPAFLEQIARELYRVSAANCWMVFWFAPKWHTEVLTCLRKAGWLVDDIPCIWEKGHGQTQQPDYYLARAYEPFFMCRKGNPKLKGAGRSNVFKFSPVPPQKKYHPTQRPLALMEEILATFCYPGEVIMVPFLGSAVTLRAAYRKHLNGFGWDLNGKNRDLFLLTIQEDIESEEI